VQLAAPDTQKVAGLYPWQWMLTGAAGVLTATTSYVAHRGTKQAKGATAIGALGGLTGGLLFSLALGRYA
jgi:hypothetical protein